MASTTTQINICDKDSDGYNYSIGFSYSLVKADDAKIVKDKNKRIRKNEPYHAKNGEYAMQAGAFGIVINNIELKHQNEKNLRLSMRFLPNKKTKVYGRNWTMKPGSTYEYDQNPDEDDEEDNYQFAIAKARKYGEKLSEEDKQLDVEETTEETGIFTIMAKMSYQKSEPEPEPEPEPELVMRGMRGGNVTRGITRGIFRGSNEPTRSISGFDDKNKEDDILKGHSLARIGNGSKATTESISVETYPIYGTNFETKIRLYVDDSTTTDIVVKFGQTREEFKASSALPPFRGN
jgi:hypothetical protein